MDETAPDAPFNWGYDPVNYNVPEGSYSTDPYHGEVRVKEFKQMVQGLHEQGIGVVLDVVYNHVYSAEDFCFNNIVPGYFSRIDQNGTYSNGSICGNDTASERSMVHKYIVDSVKYWADEYHLDGFRFDLAGLIDSDTINAVIQEVHKTHPHVIFYAEGWTMTTQVTKEDMSPLATQVNARQTPGMAYFSDMIRDAVRGSNSNASKTGYAAGAGGFDHNSYKSPDSINSIKWDTLSDPVYQDVVDYYTGLIAFRKAHSALRMTTAEEVSEKITQLSGLDFNVNGFHIAPGANGEENSLVVIFNPNAEATTVTLPEGSWDIRITGEDAGDTSLGTAAGTVEVAPISAMVLVQEGEAEPQAEEPGTPEPMPVGFDPMPLIIAAVIAAAAAIAFVLLKKKK